MLIIRGNSCNLAVTLIMCAMCQIPISLAHREPIMVDLAVLRHDSSSRFVEALLAK
jgi:hypothetical protein